MPRFNIFKDLFHGRKSRRSAEPGAIMVFLETSRWITASLFAFTAIAIVVISSVRLNSLPTQPARHDTYHGRGSIFLRKHGENQSRS